MDRKTYSLLENFMLASTSDSAHAREHIYRVLHSALAIAKTEENVDYDILLAACLLHDVGRPEQFENPDLYMSVELTELLEQALQRLPENLRETFILSRVERLSYKEIAQRLGITVKAVDNRLSRTMKILKHELKDYLPLLLFLLDL